MHPQRSTWGTVTYHFRVAEEGRSSHQEAQLHNARRRYPVDDLTAALADLRYKFGTFMDWPSDDRLVDDEVFERANPEHPRAATNRFRRQHAATFFWMLAEGDPSLVTDEALYALHRSLFDSSAAVRYDVAMALGHLNRPESGPFLEQLIATEPSAQVKDVARWAYSGRISNTYGSPITSPSPSAAFRQPGESDIVRDDNHPTNMNGVDVFFLLWAACAWERRAGLETEAVRSNFTELSRPDFSFRAVGSEPQQLCTSRLRAYRDDLEHRIGKYQLTPVTVVEACSRIESVLHQFRLFGYHEYYAGHEGDIRVRLLWNDAASWL
jgi:HEAT repeats